MYDQKWKYCAMMQDTHLPLPSHPLPPPPFSDTSYQLDVSLGVVQFHHHPLFSEEHVIASELRQTYHQYTTKLEQDRPRMLREKVCFGILVSWCVFTVSTQHRSLAFLTSTPLLLSCPTSSTAPPPQLPLLLICPSSSTAPHPQLPLLSCPTSSTAPPPHLPFLLNCPFSSTAPPPQLLFLLDCSSSSAAPPPLTCLPIPPHPLLSSSLPSLFSILPCRSLSPCSSAQCPQTFSANTPGGSGRRGQLLPSMADTILAGHYDCACYHSVHCTYTVGTEGRLGACAGNREATSPSKEGYQVRPTASPM